MMETDQKAGSCPAPGQTAVRTWISSSTRGAPRTPVDTASRFHGDGVRYKAKLIGVDPVPDAQGEKMCLDSMMKLKGFEAAARSQGKHKRRVWLKVYSGGLRIVDERTGAVIYDHDRSLISSLKKDESDPRALAYIYQHQDTYMLYYIRMATLADPVLVDIMEVCQAVDQETPQEPAEAPTQIMSLLPLNDISAPAAEINGPALENVFSPDSSSGQSNQASSTNELLEVFSPPMQNPLMPSENSCTSQPESPQPTESPKPMLSSSQILSMYPTQPVGGSPYSSPPYSPTTMPWGQQGLVGNQWAGPAVAPWPTVPGGAPTWAPAGGPIGFQPSVVMGGSTPASPTAAVNGYPNPLNPPAGTTGPQQPASTSLSNHLLL